MRPTLLAVMGALAIGFAFTPGAEAQEGNGCSEGAYSLIVTPDGGTLTILFDEFFVELADGAETVRKTCHVHAPLNLPENTSIGVYRVDYRGYAHLEARQNMELEVVYGFNGGRDHSFRRQVRGADDDNYVFTQNIGAGLMKRVGCGETAALDVEATLTVNANGQPGVAFATVDTYDGAPHGGLVYHFSLERCR